MKNIVTIKEIKKELEKLEKLEKIADSADLAYDAEPMNPEKEKAFDEAYKAQYESFMRVSAAIAELSENKINIATARSIVSGKREKLKAILKF